MELNSIIVKNCKNGIELHNCKNYKNAMLVLHKPICNPNDYYVILFPKFLYFTPEKNNT
jgi:hypothetical protein